MKNEKSRKVVVDQDHVQEDVIDHQVQECVVDHQVQEVVVNKYKEVVVNKDKEVRDYLK